MKAMIVSILFILLAPTISALEVKSRYYETEKISAIVADEKYYAIVYKPTREKIKAMLVISPTIGNMDSIEGANAQYFAKNGYAVIVPSPFINEIQKPIPDIEKLDSDYYRSVVSTISFLNIVEDKYKLPSDIPVFALGASQGGITTIMITAYIPRIKAAWYAVAGGDLPYIYAWSDVQPLVKFRNNHMSALGMTDPKAYESYLRVWLKNDPAITCKDIRVPTHQTIALHDTSVPTVTQELLAKECPTHEIQRLNVGHSGGTLSVVTKREDIKKFFERYL